MRKVVVQLLLDQRRAFVHRLLRAGGGAGGGKPFVVELTQHIVSTENIRHEAERPAQHHLTWRVLMAAFALLGALVLLAAPSLVMFALMRMDQASVRFPIGPFMTATALFLMPFLWGAGRVRDRYEERMAALGLRFK